MPLMNHVVRWTRDTLYGHKAGPGFIKARGLAVQAFPGMGDGAGEIAFFPVSTKGISEQARLMLPIEQLNELVTVLQLLQVELGTVKRTPYQQAEADEAAADFDRERVEAEIDSALGLDGQGYRFFESATAGVLAMERPSPEEVARLDEPEVRAALENASGGYTLALVDTGDWTFDDQPDEEALIFTFDLTKPTVEETAQAA